MPQWLMVLLVTIGIINIIPGLVIIMLYCAEYDRKLFMTHRWHDVQLDGKIVIILLNIIFLPVLILINTFFSIVNVFMD